MKIPTKTRKFGFSLPEVVISMAVLLMVLTSVTGILVTVIRTNSFNVESLVAYGYAQEGIEAIRMMRDSNWQLGVGFDGTTPGDDKIWGEALSDGDYKLEYVDGAGECDTVDEVSSPGSSCFPYKLENISSSAEAKPIPNAPNYARLITLDSSETDVLKVESKVEWQSANGAERELVLNTELTNWNG